MIYLVRPYRKVFVLALLLFATQLFLCILNPLNLFPVSDSVISSVIVACLALLIALLPFRTSSPINSYSPSCSNNQSVFNKKKIWIFLQILQILICIAIALPMLVVLFSLGFDFSAARSYYFFSTTFALRQIPIFIFFAFIQQSVSAIVSAIVCMNVLRRVKTPTLTYLSFFSNILLSVSTGSRTFVYELCLFTLLSYIATDPNKRPSIRQLSASIGRVVVFFLPLLPVFISRNTYGLLRFLYLYLVGPLFFFSSLIDPANPKTLELANLDRYGFSILSLDWLFLGLYNSVSGQQKINSLINLLDYPINSGAWIGDGQGLNAFPSGFYYLYMDAGLIGVFLGVLLVCLLVSICRTDTFKGKLFFIFCSASLLDMIRTGVLASPVSLLTFSLLAFL